MIRRPLPDAADRARRRESHHHFADVPLEQIRPAITTDPNEGEAAFIEFVWDAMLIASLCIAVAVGIVLLLTFRP